jgi:UrcA family protein
MLTRLNAAVLAGVTASLVAASPSLAQNDAVVVRGVPPGSKMVLVPYRDLNLNASTHRSILFGRVGDAVRNVCDFDTDFTKGTDYRTCRTKAWSGARPQMHRAFAQANRRVYFRR